MGKNKPVSWEEKERRIRESNPEALDVSWHSALKDNPDIFSRIIADVIKSSGGESKPGKRPSLDRKDASEIYHKINGEDFSEYNFVETINFLADGPKALGEACGITTNRASTLMSGRREPDFDDMEMIAEAYGKEPSYFLEYRVEFVCTVIRSYLEDSPETASAWFLNLRG